jgi:hypothetical protein
MTECDRMLTELEEKILRVQSVPDAGEKDDASDAEQAALKAAEEDDQGHLEGMREYVLAEREINCGCETFWDGGIKVSIGFTMRSRRRDNDSPRGHGKAGQRLVDERRCSIRRRSVTATHSAAHPIAMSSRPEGPLSRQDVAPFAFEQSGSRPLS